MSMPAQTAKSTRASPDRQQAERDRELLTLPRRDDGYAPIADYALIGDTRTVALVAKDGAVDWMCLPNVDNAASFSALLDRERGGRFFLGPVGEATTTRHYRDGTAILVTRHETDRGVFEVTDFMPLPYGEKLPLAPARRLVRSVKIIEGEPEIAVNLSLRPGYGARLPHWRQMGRATWRHTERGDVVLLHTPIALREAVKGTLIGRYRGKQGESFSLTLSFDRGMPAVIMPSGKACEKEQHETEAFWSQFVGRIRHEGPFHAAVKRSIVTLRLLTFSLSGAIVAAPTTSLPEAIGGKRNWDYRYCWLRDASFVLRAFMTSGCEDEGAGFFRWLVNATQLTAPRLQTLYTVFGRTDVTEQTLDTLEGYKCSAPVNCGNGAQSQLQLDAYGEMLRSGLIFVEEGGTLGWAEQKRLSDFARAARQDWTKPDNGLWEMRGGRRHITYSKVQCFAAFDAMVQLIEKGAIDDDPEPWKNERDLVRDRVMRLGWNEQRGAFTGAFGYDFLDASLLLMPRLGIIRADDPRMVATFEAIERELGHGAQIRRYRHGIDGFDSREGTFTACGFWAADYLARRGDIAEAERRVKELLSHANDLGLMSEELDPETGELLGNFPQGFSHAGFVGAAIAIEEARAQQGNKG